MGTRTKTGTTIQTCSLKASGEGMKHQLEVMLTTKSGVIINNALVTGLMGSPSVAYSAMKHGVVGITKSASRQYAGEGIRFNAVCPG
ncbi:MAG: SDR family oxidoreductase [Chromatiales bacterium]|nr:SDR family oxidoreductase [Chromatiales bacterium]